MVLYAVQLGEGTCSERSILVSSPIMTVGRTKSAPNFSSLELYDDITVVVSHTDTPRSRLGGRELAYGPLKLPSLDEQASFEEFQPNHHSKAYQSRIRCSYVLEAYPGEF